MQISTTKKKNSCSRYFIISTFFIVLFFASSLPALAQDTNSIDTLRRMGNAFASIAEKASPAVVGIEVEKTVTLQDYPTLRDWPFAEPFSPFDDDFFNKFFYFRFPQRRYEKPKSRQVARGSGFIISSDGYILTNNHLVGEAERVTVKLADDREFTAEIIGTDRESDVAVIKIDADNLHTLELGDSDALEVGEWVIAIGNPFGLSHTVTAGIVSAKGRSNIGVAEFEDFIQTDAAINFGNSGGPLLNLDGKVVGINTAIIGPGGNIGIGLAIPINMAKAIRKQLVETGKVVRGFLGVSIRDLDPVVAESLGLEDTKGVAIGEVTEGSAAEKAGIEPYDVVVEFNGKKVENANEFRNRVAMLKPGTKVEIVVLRDGKRKKLTARLGKRPAGGGVTGEPTEAVEKLGLTVQTLTDELARRLGYEELSGVLVTRVESGSEAARKRIKAGMLIMEVNRKPVKNAEEFYDAIEKGAKKGTYLFLINDGRYTFLVGLRLPKK
ncbi:MAG: Do family serine endopeptidase [Sedimentisphaerales bacterium]